MLVRANFVHALNNENAIRLEDPFGFECRFEIQIQYGLVILLAGTVCGNVVPVIVLVVLMVHMDRAAGSVHERRVKNNAVQACIFIGQSARIDARL